MVSRTQELPWVVLPPHVHAQQDFHMPSENVWRQPVADEARPLG